MTSESTFTAEDDLGVRESSSALCSLRDLRQCRIAATDGIAGSVDDIYFDDEAWVVRYFVVRLGTDAEDRRVLMPLMAIVRCDWHANSLHVSLSGMQLSASSAFDTHKPVFRQQILASLDHYSGLGYGESAAEYLRACEAEAKADGNAPAQSCARDDPNLRSANEVVGYQVHALDGETGDVKSLLIAEKTWIIRYLLVANSCWGCGKEVLIAPESIDEVSWSDAEISVHLARQTVKELPAYQAS